MKNILCLISSFVLANAFLLNIGYAQDKQTNPTLSDVVSSELDQDIDSTLSEIIERHKLTGTPTSNAPIPYISSPIAQLGMKLFYSKSLGGNKNAACVSCHHPMLGGGDNLSLPVGVAAEKPQELGTDRLTIDSEHTKVPRNAPTTFNVAFWKKNLFHDARITRLANNEITTPDMSYPEPDLLAGNTLVQAQARFPITSADEMRGEFLNTSLNQTLRRALAKRLQTNWLEAFQTGFEQHDASAEELITEQNYSEAIAAFERSQVLIENPWKRYIEGDTNALSMEAKKGAKLFFTPQHKGGAGCASCHSGDFFTNENLYNVAMPQVGLGKENGKTGSNDFGAELATKKSADRFKFRTPSLLNVEMTGPWSHSGAYTSLEAVVRHMLTPEASAENYDQSQIKQKNISMKDQKKNTKEALNHGIHIIPKPNTTDEDVRLLVSFLKNLTDPCTKDRECMSKWIPAADMNDPDGMMLHAVDATTGKPL